jgi:class I fructose-bisphosphate aldolase
MPPLPRLQRLFAADSKCFDVAIDHGFFNERSFLEGIEDIRSAIRTIIDAAPDAIQLSGGQAVHLHRCPGPRRPALVMRTDIANAYGQELPRSLFSHLTEDAVTQAVRLDAACVVVNLLLLPDQPELHHQCIENICRLKPTCEALGMPLMVEPLVMQVNAIHGGYMVDGNLDKILPLVRQAVELGAHVIKADPCDDVGKYHQVITIAGGVPVLVRGGGKASEEEILERTFAVMQQGASGIVYGRNIIQHEHPALMTRALMAVVHDGATPAQALKLLRSSR